MKFNLGFHDYKIDEVALKAEKELNLIHETFPLENVDWEFSLLFKRPMHSPSIGSYFVGMVLQGSMNLNSEEIVERRLAELSLSIVGSFTIVGDDLTDQDISQLLYVNGNAILLPYLRAAASNIIMCSGFGYAKLPVINLVGLVKKTVAPDGVWPTPAEIREPTVAEQLALPTTE